MESGYDDVQAMAGGLDAWIRTGGPVEPKPA
jgi:rhodanese-related sulfurtransferase